MLSDTSLRDILILFSGWYVVGVVGDRGGSLVLSENEAKMKLMIKLKIVKNDLLALQLITVP